MTERYARLPSLTAARGVAALMVATFHASLVWPSALEPIASLGWLGVSFFFILSGFVLTWSFSDERPYSEFMAHRIARIFPVHLLCLAVVLCLFFVFRRPFGGYVGTPIGTVLQVFLVHDFVPGHPEIRQAWDGVAWSLSAEFFFYLFAPFIIRRLLGMPGYKLLNMAISLYVVHLLVGLIARKAGFVALYDFMQYHPIAYMPLFIYGIVGAILLKRGVQIRVNLVLKVLLFLPVLVYCFRQQDRDAIAMIAMTAPAFVAFILDQARRDASGKRSLLGHSVFEKIGEISFSLYMVHAILLAIIAGAVARLHLTYHPIRFTAALLVVSLIASYVMYEVVELPMKKFVLSLFSRHRRSSSHTERNKNTVQ
ncbi:peptidoglycan/LPS O-acetylase OafA/YrhL [Paraburkholderia caballeronis]|nr:peptidoglycan/LPS O-acetylase OafA/YrhL [Paraburkholderia caballeronis]